MQNLATGKAQERELISATHGQSLQLITLQLSAEGLSEIAMQAETAKVVSKIRCTRTLCSSCSADLQLLLLHMVSHYAETTASGKAAKLARLHQASCQKPALPMCAVATEA